jgi:hypothetical protein
VELEFVMTDGKIVLKIKLPEAPQGLFSSRCFSCFLIDEDLNIFQVENEGRS